MHKIPTLFSFIFLLLFLPGCSKPYAPYQIKPQESKFKGINQLFSGEKNEVSIFHIHGMCHHSFDSFYKKAELIASQLGFSKSSEISIDSANRDKIDSNGVQGWVLKYIQKDDSQRIIRKLNFFGINFSNATLPFKEKLCSDVSSQSAVCPHPEYIEERARINGSIKSILLDDCLVDPVVYIGSEGKNIRSGILVVFNFLMVSVPENSNIIFIADSLGSKILGDTLICSAKPSGHDFNRTKIFVENLSSIFLLSNQIPLLNLGHLEPPCNLSPDLKNYLLSNTRPQQFVTGKASQDDNEHFFQEELNVGGLIALLNLKKAIYNESKSDQTKKNYKYQPQLVSFTDPNDLLSYEINPSDLRGYQATNVLVSNAWTFLGLLEWPVSAHGDYKTNDSLIELLIYGNHDKTN